jgi:hypothetical protein
MAENIRDELESLRRRPRKSDSENTAKSDGASLAPGSSEYREYLRDHQGMDRFEQQKYERNKAYHRSGDVITPEKDEWHEEMAQKLAGELAKRRVMRDMDEDGRLSTAERKVSHQIRKNLHKGDVERMAAKRAAQTPSPEDDKAVKRRLPKDLDKLVYDDGVEDDEFYPGAKVLNKYF